MSMAEELFDVLIRLDSSERTVEHDEMGLRAFQDEMRAGFSEMHRRFDRRDALNREISATLARIEERRKR